jgi:protein-S-isoprenylcysteine O-methyltransferase Ste14
MMAPSESSAHAAVFYQTSEFLGIIHLIFAWSVQRLIPLRAFDPFSTFGRQVVGSLLIGVGAVVLRFVQTELAKNDQPRQPGLPTTKLVTSGVFGYSRHPTYSAILLLITPGLGLVLGNPWAIWTIPLSVIAFYYVMVRPEEAYLHSNFPDEYKRYCSETRRWI